MLAQITTQVVEEASTLNQVLEFANKFGGGVVVPIVLAVLAYQQVKAKFAAEKVATTLEKSTASTDKKLDATHGEVLEVKQQTNGHLTALTEKVDRLESIIRSKDHELEVERRVVAHAQATAEPQKMEITAMPDIKVAEVKTADSKVT